MNRLEMHVSFKFDWKLCKRTPFVTLRFMVIVLCIISPSIFQFNVTSYAIFRLYFLSFFQLQETLKSSLNLTQFLFILQHISKIFVANINHLGSISAKCLYAQKSINVIKTLHKAFEYECSLPQHLKWHFQVCVYSTD